MKALLLEKIEKHFGPKISAITAFGLTVYTQAQERVQQLAEADVTTTITEVVTQALSNPTLATMVPAPLAAAAAYLIREAKPVEPTHIERSPDMSVEGFSRDNELKQLMNRVRVNERILSEHTRVLRNIQNVKAITELEEKPTVPRTNGTISTLEYEPVHKFSERSRSNLRGVHALGIELANRMADEIDFTVISGYRTPEEQLELVAKGTGIDPAKSYHTKSPAQAFDFIPHPFKGWNDLESFYKVARVAKRVADEMGLRIVSGAIDWQYDEGHIQFEIR